MVGATQGAFLSSPSVALGVAPTPPMRPLAESAAIGVCVAHSPPITSDAPALVSWILDQAPITKRALHGPQDLQPLHVMHSGWRDSVQVLAKLRQDIATFDGTNPSVVAYPCGGFDPAPLVLFPNADLYVYFDLIPFANTPAAERCTLSYPLMEQGAFWTATDVEELAKTYGMRACLLGACLYTIPEFRVTEVHSFATTDHVQRSTTETPIGSRPGVYGTITFDRGAGTRQQTLVYLHANLNESVPRFWWHRIVEEYTPTAILYKAALDQFSRPREATKRTLREHLIALGERPGTFVVSGAIVSDKWELPIDLAKGISTVRTCDEPFGYAHDVLLYKRGPIRYPFST